MTIGKILKITSIENAFSNQLLVRPSGEANFTTLVQKLDRWCRRQGEDFSGTDHLVFLLIDGLGDRLLSRLGPDSFLKTNQKRTLKAVYPSTTSVALTTLATGLPPAEHGSPGWWAYLPQENLSITPLPFQERFTRTPLELDYRVVWNREPWLAKSQVATLAIQPKDFWNSTFSQYLRGFHPGFPYTAVEDCAAVVREHQSKNEDSFSLIYWPEFDSACHQFGCYAEETKAVMQRLDRAAEALAHSLCPRSTLVITADHGLIDIEPEKRLTLEADSEIARCLVVPPTGEPRNPIFHLKPGRSSEFVERFGERFQEQFNLICPSELPILLGGELSATAQQRFGDFVGVATVPVVLHYLPSGSTMKPGFIGYHGGLTPGEMWIPWIETQS
jgi:type I phosphodiesterase/nucleotide pyrophosphatase